MIYNGKEYELQEKFDIKNIGKDTLEIEIPLNNIKNITNMSYMFYSCQNLIYLPNINLWNKSNVTNMDHLFYSCGSLKYLPDVSKWNTSKITNMYQMLCHCYK